MLESISVVTTWSGNITPQETVTLDYEGRSKRRCLMQTDKGREFLLNLPNATILKHGNVLEINDGSFVLVIAKEEDVIEIKTDDAAVLAEIAWSLGNMHRLVEILPLGLRTRYDHIVENDYKHFPVKITRHKATFTPKKNY